MVPSLAVEFRSVDDVERGLQELERHFLLRRDRRGVFATAYLHITRSIELHLEAGGFIDPVWVRQYLVRFGNLYRQALLDYERGNSSAVPKAWRISFDAATAGNGFVIQHLILGVNAHINHDLAIALFRLGIDPERSQKYRDHTTVNAVLEAATLEMKHRVGTLYEPLLQRLDRLAGREDDRITSFSIPKAREHAWTFAVALTCAPGEPERRQLRRALDEQAAVIARLVLASPTRHPAMVRAVGIAARVDSLLRRLRPAPRPAEPPA